MTTLGDIQLDESPVRPIEFVQKPLSQLCVMQQHGLRVAHIIPARWGPSLILELERVDSNDGKCVRGVIMHMAVGSDLFGKLHYWQRTNKTVTVDYWLVHRSEHLNHCDRLYVIPNSFQEDLTND